MERNVLSSSIAVAKGYKPAIHTYDVHQIPLGEFNAILDLKIWSKRILAINCYFTKTDTYVQFVITVYCNNNTGDYKLSDSTVNFALRSIGVAYRINVARNAKKITLIKADLTSLLKNIK